MFSVRLISKSGFPFLYFDFLTDFIFYGHILKK